VGPYLRFVPNALPPIHLNSEIRGLHNILEASFNSDSYRYNNTATLHEAHVRAHVPSRNIPTLHEAHVRAHVPSRNIPTLNKANFARNEGGILIYKAPFECTFLCFTRKRITICLNFCGTNLNLRGQRPQRF
jgi:hypothetical protein